MEIRDSRHISFPGRLLALGLLSLLATAAWSGESQPRMVDFAKAHADSTLVGKRIRIHACIAIPMSDTDSGPRDMIVLYPCAAKLSSDEEVEKTAIAARPASEAALASLRDAGVPLVPEIQADVSGRLTRQQLEAKDPRKYLLLEYDDVSNLTRYQK